MNNNKYFWRGILFLIIGILLLTNGLGIFSNFMLIALVVTIFMIYKGIQLLKDPQYRFFGQILIALGAFQIIIYLGIPLTFILSIFFLLFGIYFILVKSNVMFKKNKGVFKDSRDIVYIKEKFSNVTVNNISKNIIGVEIHSIYSTLDLSFLESDVQPGRVVEFNVKAYFSSIKINTSSKWDVMVNDRYIRRIEGNNRTVNIKCKNFYSVIDVM